MGEDAQPVVGPLLPETKDLGELDKAKIHVYQTTERDLRETSRHAWPFSTFHYLHLCLCISSKLASLPDFSIHLWGKCI